MKKNSIDVVAKRRQKQSDVSIEEEMEFYNGRYFGINKKMMTTLGLWPYQTKISKIILRFIITICIIVPNIPQVIRMVVFRTDAEIFIQSVGTIFYFLAMGIKYYAMIITEEKLKMLYKNMVKNWRILETDDERRILKAHSEMGRLLTVGYVGYMFCAGSGFVFLPITPRMINMIFPIFNGSITEMFILDGEYLIDKRENYYYIYMFEVCCSVVTIPVFSTVDSTYATCIQQGVGLYYVVNFEIIPRLRLNLATSAKAISSDCKDKDATYQAISKAAQLHEKVLNFAGVLESSYSNSLLLVMASSTCTLIAVTVCILFNLNNPVLLVRYIAFMVGVSMHLFYLSWPGQKVIDASNDIFFAAYDNEWYECSVESQQLLKFIMRRTIEPFCLTAGGFYIMNFENFEMYMKTAMSYITVLRSFE